MATSFRATSSLPALDRRSLPWVRPPRRWLFGLVTLLLFLAMGLAGCGASSTLSVATPSVATPPVAGMWVGMGTVTSGIVSELFAVYLDLSTGAQITGTGSSCVAAGRNYSGRNAFTITGALGISPGSFTMKWTDTNPTATIPTLVVNAHVSRSQMMISGYNPSYSPPLTNSATLMHGSMNDYNAQCTSLPTPTPSS